MILEFGHNFPLEFGHNFLLESGHNFLMEFGHCIYLTEFRSFHAELCHHIHLTSVYNSTADRVLCCRYPSYVVSPPDWTPKADRK